MKARDRPLNRVDHILLAIVAASSVASAAYAYFEIESWFQTNPGLVAYANRPSNLPASVRAWEVPLGRACVYAEAALMVAGTGLALIAIRPGRLPTSGRAGAGEIASTITALMFAGWLIQTAQNRWIEPLIPLPSGTVRATLMNVGVWWPMANGIGRYVPWIILSGWAYLAITRQWRASRGRLDQLGRWVGWSWLGTKAMAGVVMVLAQL